jgi:hypothetical protein
MREPWQFLRIVGPDAVSQYIAHMSASESVELGRVEMAELIGAPAAVGRAAEREWRVVGGTTALWTLLTPCGGRGPVPSGKTGHRCCR